jgi:hypothetical protein
MNKHTHNKDNIKRKTPMKHTGMYWKTLAMAMFVAEPVYSIRRTVLDNPMLPQRMREVTQVCVDFIGGRAWINVHEWEIVTQEQAERAGYLLLPARRSHGHRDCR